MSQFTGSASVFTGIPQTYTSTSQELGLGQGMEGNDGRMYRYAKVGSVALVAGHLLQGPAEVTGNQSRLVAATAVGAMTITTVDTVTVTVNQYAGGYAVATAEGGTGNGYAYRIKSHPAATSAVVTLTLEEPVQVAMTTSTQIDLVANPFNGVIDCIASATSAPVGVAINTAAASSYAWIQVRGPGIVLNDATAALGVNDGISSSNGVAGSVEFGVARQPNIGYALTGIAQSEFGVAYLRIS